MARLRIRGKIDRIAGVAKVAGTFPLVQSLRGISANFGIREWETGVTGIRFDGDRDGSYADVVRTVVAVCVALEVVASIINYSTPSSDVQPKPCTIASWCSIFV